jgi:hypothetical protein
MKKHVTLFSFTGIGILLFLLPCFVFATNPAKIKLQPEQIFAGSYSPDQIMANDSIIIGDSLQLSMQVPLAPWWGYSFTQTLYLQPEINIADKRIYQIGYKYGGLEPMVDFDIEVWLSHTTLTELTAAVPLTDFTKVYDGPYVVAAGEEFSIIDIDAFYYNNTDNLIVFVIEKKPGYTTTTDQFFCTPNPDGQFLCVGARNDQSPYDPNNLPAGSAIEHRANTKLMFQDVPTDPEIKVMPDSLDFGEVETTLNAVLSVKVMNIGGGNLEITGADISDSHFTILNPEFPLTLGTGEFHLFDVQFAPTDPGLVEADLTFIIDESIPGLKTAYLAGRGLRFGVLREGFEGELFPPLGWKVYDNNNDAKGWYRNVLDAPTGQTVPHTGIAAAGLDTYAGSPGVISYDDWLITPKMTWQDGDIFKFFIKRLANQDGQVWRVCLSTTGDLISNFTPIDVITDPPVAYIEKSYDLSQEGLTNGQGFYIGIQFNSLWCWPGAIDDFLGSVKVSFENDLMAIGFTGNDIIYENTASNFTAEIGNSGFNPVAAGDYVVNACALVNGTETVFGTMTGVAIPAGESVALTIPVTIAQTGVYEMYSKIVWSGDQNPINNMSDNLEVEVIGTSIVVKNIGDFPINQQTDYYNLYPINFSDYRGASLSECLYYDTELNTGGIVTRLSYYTAFGSTLPSRRIQVFMKETAKENYDLGAYPASELQLVFDGNIDFTEGVHRVNIDLTQPFVYTGGGNISVMVYYFLGGNPFIVDDGLFAYKYMESGPTRTGFDNWYTTINPDDLSHFSYVANYPFTSLMFDTGNGLGNLSGKVFYDEVPGPVEGAKVVIENADFPDTKAEIYTNAEGEYVAPFTMAGNTITVTISKFGFIDVVFENVSLASGGTVVLGDAIMVIRPSVMLSGNVIKSDTQGAASGATVKLLGVDNYETTTNNDGHFEFPEIWGLTSYQIEVTLDGYQTYQNVVDVETANVTLETITILENAPNPHFVNVVEDGDNTLLTWFGSGAPFPFTFRYDDGNLVGNLITTGTPTVVGGSAWPYNSIVTGVQWFTGNAGGYPPSPKIMITILGLNADGSPNPADVLFTEPNVTNVLGWNTFNITNPVYAPNGFFFGISGYSLYTIIAYDNGVGEPYVWQPRTQWSNGMGAYYPLENVTAPPLSANIFMRASGMIYEIDGNKTFDTGKPYVLNIPEGTTPYICQPCEPIETGDPIVDMKGFTPQDSRAFDHYNIYRKLIEAADWQQINTGPVTDTAYIDTEWQNLEEGFYKYAVEAEFTNGVLSERIESNVIERIIDGVGEAGAGMLQIFPNPTSGLVTVNSDALIKNLSVLDNSGCRLLVKEVDALNCTFDVSSLKEGLYFIRIQTTEGEVVRKISVIK